MSSAIETYSYADARLRVPSAWKLEVIDGGTWKREVWHDVAPDCLGTFVRRGKSWVYVCPNGYALTVSDNYGVDTPPVLPRLNPRKCGCREGSHTCSACGQPYWIEFHGVADGCCSYCYYAG